jgi:MFS family permease
MLAICIAFAAASLLLPFVAIREEWRALPKKGWTALYFASLGLGFMAFEIPMIQKLTLFLGYPTYTLTVTLFGLLVFSGIGSLLSERYAGHRRRALGILTAVIVAIAIFTRTGLDPLLHVMFGLPLGLRVLVALFWLAPIGVCLGAYMPVGLAAVARLAGEQRAPEYAAWAWAVNGFFSVIGSMLVTIFAMTFGFPTVLLGATLLYVFAALVLARLDASVSA